MAGWVNAFRRALDSGQFVVTVEYVPPDRSEPVDDLVDLGRYVRHERRVQAVVITDRVGSPTTHSSVELALEARDVSGKMPVVSLSGKSCSAPAMGKRLARMRAVGLANPVVVTGDGPRVARQTGCHEQPDAAAAEGFVDSVQTIDMARSVSGDFCIGGAVNGFKYTESALMMQYLKLGKKRAAGLQVVFNQVGYDLRKTQELILYLRHRKVRLPVMAAVYWLTPAFAGFANRGKVPGVLVGDDLVELLDQWSDLPDQGRAQRIDMLTLHIALVRLFGYAGVHLGGFGKAESLCEVLDHVDQLLAGRPSVDELWQRWCDLTRLDDGRPVALGLAEGYYLFRADRRGLNSAEPMFDDASMPTWPTPHHARIESDCAKGLSAGPCGGCRVDGRCEVAPDRRCAWIEVHERATTCGRVDQLI